MAIVIILTMFVNTERELALSSNVSFEVKIMSLTGVSIVTTTWNERENISNIVVSATSFRTLTCLIIASTLFITTPNLSETLFNTNVYAYTIRLLSIDACFVGIVLFALLSRIVSRYTLLPKMLSGLFFWIVMDLMGFVSLFFRNSKLTVIGLGH